MVQKRSLGEELYELSSKQPRQLEPTDEMISVLEFPDKNVAPKPHALGGESGGFSLVYNPEYEERLEGGDVAELRAFTEKELEASVPGSISNFSWPTSTTSEEDIRSGAPFRIFLSPGHCNLDHPVRTIIHDGDTYSSLLEYPPRKLVPIGREFQVEIPEWVCGNGKTSTYLGNTPEEINLPAQSLESDISRHLDHGRLAGTCVIPMPEIDMSENNVEKPGGGRINCCCGDVGSTRCVRQHITEAREKLWTSLGEKIFLELGFCEMGEVVSEKWSEKEEKIFYEGVFSNPASLGKNFWDHLAIEFPSKTKKEIISYYFNVFMLRKRAEQNRFDPLKVDSDNDEWEGTDDSTEEAEKINELDDSVVESPGYEDGFDHNEIYNKYGYKVDIACETLGDDTHEIFGGNRVISNISESCPNEVLDNCGSVPTSERVLSNEQGDQDIQDSPCISDDTGIAPKVVSEKVNISKHGTGSPSRLSSSSGHEFLLEPCSSKDWDVGYLSYPKNEEFLSTCSMIEEVFGAEAWNYKTRDG